MSLTDQQVRELKNQLLTQIQHLPEEQRKQAQQHIESMSTESLEMMLKQQQERTLNPGEKTIFRMIIDKEVDTIEVGHNQEAIAVLDINPISKGHSIIIPKKPVVEVQNLSEECFTLSKTLAKKIQTNLKAKSVEMQTEKKFNEYIIHLIPVYDAPLTLQSPRQKSSLEELKKVAQDLNPPDIEKPRVIKIKQKTDQPSPPLKLPRRIP